MNWMDKRQQVRAPVKKKGRLRLVDGRDFPILTLDLSMGGVSLQIEEPLKHGTQCLVRIENVLPNGTIAPIEAVAEVRYQVVAGVGRCRLGMMFLQVRPECVKLLERLVAQASALGYQQSQPVEGEASLAVQ